MAINTDFTLFHDGSICVLTPITDAAQTWADEHLPEDAMTWAGGVVVEPRYIEDILDGLQNDGLTVNA